jgi:formylglycine-generating enzyme required for sulfatase activity
MSENPSGFSKTGSRKDRVKDFTDPSNFPVENVSWVDAMKFCEKLSSLPEEKRLGRVYRLPTEAEWEYSCRGAALTSPPFHFGKDVSARQANFDGRFPYGGAAKGSYLGRTTAVGSYQPNAFGLYDMHGNVLEWCSDWFDEDYYQNSPRQDPKGPKTGSERVCRGGSLSLPGKYCRSALRGMDWPTERNDNIGFRAALNSVREPGQK